MLGRGKVIMTGQLGDVMKESASLAMTWIRSHAEELGELLGVDAAPLLMGEGGSTGEDGSDDVYDMHIHFPAGAVPKDGPSAGVAITTAIISLLTNRSRIQH
jgi:ATP-dependent Lon protease